MKNIHFVSISLFLLQLSFPAFGQSNKALDEVGGIRAERWAKAEQLEMAAPVYRVVDGMESTIFLINNTTIPIEVELRAHAPAGDVLPLGTFYAEPNRHLAVELSDLLIGHEDLFGRGSLTATFLGDSAAIQAWVVLRQGEEVAELAFEVVAPGHRQHLVSFWPATRRAAIDSKPHYYLFNASDLPLAFSAKIASGPETIARWNDHLKPRERREISPAEISGLDAGWIEITTHGAAAAWAATGLFEGPGLRVLPFVTAGEVDQGNEYHAVRIPAAADTVFNFFNPEPKALEVNLDLLDFDSGALLETVSLTLEHHEVRSASLYELFGVGRSSGELRLRLQATDPFLVTGGSFSSEGAFTDIAIFPAAKAHKNGRYPLPELEHTDVVTTLVNLGDEPAQIGGQISWNTGTWAFGPIELGPREARRLNIRDLAKNGSADVLGRSLDPSYAGGFLKWTTLSGSTDLIARTEAQPHGLEDSFGFNCFGCCYELSRGVVVPSSVSFLPGQTPTFQSCLTIEDCAGSTGPFPTSPLSISSPSPFSWNGTSVGASAAAARVLSFDGEGPRVTVTQCQSSMMPIFADGDADTCKALLGPYDQSKGCDLQTSNCSDCYSCCENIRKKADCLCGLLPGSQSSCKELARNACQTCKQANCFGTFTDNCTENPVCNS